MRIHNAVVILATMLSLTACTSEGPTLPRAGVTAADVSPLLARVPKRPINEEFKRLAVTDPGFTGVFLDTLGQLTIVANRQDFSDAARKRVTAWARSYAGVAAESRPHFRVVKYDYQTLDKWLSRMFQASSVVEHIFSMSIDETQGRLRFGVESAEKAARLVAALAQHGVPADMHDVQVYAPPTPSGTLNQYYPYRVAGLQINGPIGGCTLGFTLLKWDTGIDPVNSPKYFLTAGHCSSDWGVSTGTVFSQVTPGFERIGAEHQIVPIRFNDPTCPVDPKNGGNGPCTDADALVGRYDDTVSVLYGRVATVHMPSKVIHNTLSVVGTTSGAITGQNVYLVAQQTGQHNNGRILESCSNVFYKKPTQPTLLIWVLCTQVTNNLTYTGDSGAPFFVLYNSSYPNTTPSVVGIQAASNYASRTWLSPISQIDKGLGGGRYFWQ